MRVPTFDEYAWAEAIWLGYPTSRQYHPNLAKFIINHSPSKDTMEYMGAYLLALSPSFAKKYISPKDKDVNLDVVYINHSYNFKPTKTYGPTQSKFSNLKQLASIRQPTPNKVGVYFFGELHDTAGFVHWNIAFLTPTEMMFFDPVLDSQTYSPHQTIVDYEYDFKSRKAISEAFGVKESVYVTLKRPQWVCRSNLPFTDLYCQTWSLLFLDIYCNDLTEQFMDLDFQKYQTEIVKTWVVCTINRMKIYDSDWDLFTKEELKAFPFCLKRGKGNKPIVTALHCQTTSQNCAQMIVNTFR